MVTVTTTTTGLTRGEILRVVNRYIGVSGGYLGDFSYRTHAEFYPEFCDILDIDPYEHEGTTRERFIEIVENASPMDQAKIVRGVLKKYPLGSEPHRTQEMFDGLERMASRLEGGASVPSPQPTITTTTVDRAISDAEALIQQGGATSAVDRVHTCLHGYLMAVCDEAAIACPPEPTLTQLLNELRLNHPHLQARGPRGQDVVKVLRSFGAVLDALQPVRNKASMAHPNQSLLDEAEAMLFINATRTVVHYIDRKVT